MSGAADVVVAGTLAPTIGGIAAAIDDQVAGLRAAGLRVTTVNTGQQRRARPGRAAAENVAAALSDAVRVAREVRRTRAAVLDVHTVGSPLLPALRALALATAGRAAGARAVVHLHGYDLDTTLERAPAGYRRALRTLARVAASVVTLDEVLAEAVRRRCPRTQVVAIANCVPVPKGASEPVASVAAGPPWPERIPKGASAHRMTDDGRVRLVFVGTVGQRKGVVDLLAALHSVDKRVTADIVGGGGEEGPEAFDRLVAAGADLVRDGRVVFHGELDRSAAGAVLARGDVFVLPSRAEGMPVALLEAMSCGLPVVVTDVGAMGRVVDGADCGIVVPTGDLTALAAAITELASDPARRLRLGAAGRRAIEEQYSCERTIGALIALYRDVAQPGP